MREILNGAIVAMCLVAWMVVGMMTCGPGSGG